MSLADVARRHVSTSDGLKLQVVEGGNPSGPSILFIHGYLSSSDAFRRQFEGPLSKTHRLIGLDLRGHGGSEKPLDLAAYVESRVWADDVSCVLDAFDIERAVIVGWSLGSRVAVNYAWTYGFGRIAALNLVGAALAPHSHGPDAGLPPRLHALLSADEGVRLDATRGLMNACGVDDRDLLQAFTAAAMEVPLPARHGAREWPIPYDGGLSWIAASVLFTHGKDDSLVSEATVRAQADAIPGAELALIEGAGHFAFLQRAEDFDRDLAGLAARTF